MTSFINLNTSDTIETFNNVSKTSDRPLSICHGPTASPSDYFCKIIVIFKLSATALCQLVGFNQKKKHSEYPEMRYEMLYEIWGWLKQNLKGKGGFVHPSHMTCRVGKVASKSPTFQLARQKRSLPSSSIQMIIINTYAEKVWSPSFSLDLFGKVQIMAGQWRRGHLPNFTSWPMMEFYSV